MPKLTEITAMHRMAQLVSKLPYGTRLRCAVWLMDYVQEMRDDQVRGEDGQQTMIPGTDRPLGG